MCVRNAPSARGDKIQCRQIITGLPPHANYLRQPREIRTCRGGVVCVCVCGPTGGYRLPDRAAVNGRIYFFSENVNFFSN